VGGGFREKTRFQKKKKNVELEGRKGGPEGQPRFSKPWHNKKKKKGSFKARKTPARGSGPFRKKNLPGSRKCVGRIPVRQGTP